MQNFKIKISSVYVSSFCLVNLITATPSRGDTTITSCLTHDDHQPIIFFHEHLSLCYTKENFYLNYTPEKYWAELNRAFGLDTYAEDQIKRERYMQSATHHTNVYLEFNQKPVRVDDYEPKSGDFVITSEAKPATDFNGPTALYKIRKQGYRYLDDLGSNDFHAAFSLDLQTERLLVARQHSETAGFGIRKFKGHLYNQPVMKEITDDKGIDIKGSQKRTQDLDCYVLFESC